ncbi:hypothetical protein ACIPJN_30005 [Streptomyces sp. NPDC086796]|uniref:hypothetical protein n=1 Tax=Streptomyces sp. NPDC086796 TaxID=3365760 RepID=UPI003806D72F
MTTHATRRWCDDREHPFVTYHPWLDRSYCRCGRRQEAGALPLDWQAKHETHHNCELAGPCRCYVQGKPVSS